MRPEHYEAMAQAQAVIDRLRPSCPGLSGDIEDKMTELLENGKVERTGDIKTDFLTAYALALFEDGAMAKN